MSQIQGSWHYNSANSKVNSFGKIISPSTRYLVGTSYENYSSKQSIPIAYNLAGQYDRFTCTLSNKSSSSSYGYKMYIYGDDKLLYESPNFISSGVKVDVDLDVGDVQTLKFVAEKKGDNNDTTFDFVTVFDPTLWK